MGEKVCIFIRWKIVMFSVFFDFIYRVLLSPAPLQLHSGLSRRFIYNYIKVFSFCFASARLHVLFSLELYSLDFFFVSFSWKIRHARKRVKNHRRVVPTNQKSKKKRAEIVKSFYIFILLSTPATQSVRFVAVFCCIHPSPAIAVAFTSLRFHFPLFFLRLTLPYVSALWYGFTHLQWS